jgi:hypothetical protein
MLYYAEEQPGVLAREGEYVALSTEFIVIKFDRFVSEPRNNRDSE